MPRRVAVTGAGGQLGRQLVRAFRARGDVVWPLARPDFDITRPHDLTRLAGWRPHVVVNSAAWTDVDGCARDPERARQVNAVAAGAVAEAAASTGALAVQISTNEVFDGSLDRPYTEDDLPNPVNPYGASKLAGERLVAEAASRHLIVRTAWLFGPGGTNFVTKILVAADRVHAAQQPLRVVADEWGNPTWTPALADAVCSAVIQEATGIRHLAGSPAISRFGWAERILALAGRDVLLEPISSAAFSRPSVAPPRAVIRSVRDAIELDWQAGLEGYLAQYERTATRAGRAD